MVMRLFARFLSLIFHPIFIPFYAILFLVWLNPYAYGPLPVGFNDIIADPVGVMQFSFKWLFTSALSAAFVIRTVLLWTIFFPLFIILLMRQLDFIDSFTTADVRQRILMSIPVSCMLIWTLIVFYKNLPNDFYHDKITAIMLGTTIALSMAIIIMSVSEKISLHAMGMGGLFAVVLYATNIATFDISYFIMGALFLGGLVGTARLQLGEHKPREVYSGYLLGFLSQASALIFLVST